MSEIRAVLLVPEPGDPHELLAEGPCGARPPIAQKDPGIGQWFPLPDPWFSGSPDTRCPRALVLAWDGKIVEQAFWRKSSPWNDLYWSLRAWTRGDSSIEAVQAALTATRPEWVPGTLVLLDANDREVKP